ncbi:MAG: AAA family ATPase [Synergistaceae bacterium]|jgi:KaiC/GvpD/RAD55 family RecA-like ATPase|nr:AAA family ATPase [Synergistaceae bacterium]
MPVSAERLRELAALLPEEPKRAPGRQSWNASREIDVPAWVADHLPGVGIAKEKPWNGGTIYVLSECPFDPSHAGDSCIIRFASGAVAFKCLHSSCQGHDWRTLREAFDTKKDQSGSRRSMPYDDVPFGDEADCQQNGSYYENDLGMWVQTAGGAEPVNAEVANGALFALRRTIDTSVDLPPIDMIGGLFPRKHISLVIAAPGTGKTWFLQRLASDLSVGGSVFDGFAETEPRKVMIFAGEAGYELLIRRGTTMKWPVDIGNIDVFSGMEAEKNEISLDLDTQEGKVRFEALIDKFRPDIVFIDTLSAFHASDENSSKEMRPLFRYLTKAADEMGIAIVAIHHTRKRKTSERSFRMNQDEAIGSSILNRFSAMILGLEAMPKDTDLGGNPTILVWTQKAWYEKPPPFTFKLEKDDNGRLAMKIDLDPVVGGSGRVTDRIYIYIQTKYQPGEWFSPKDIIDGMKGAVSDSSIRKCLWELAERGTLAREGENRWVRYMIAAEEDCAPF